MINLSEEIIGSVADNIKVTLDINKSKHAGDRQTRHEDDFISDQDIRRGISDAVQAIAKNLMLDTLEIGSYVCISNRKFRPVLNIVGNIKRKGNQLQLIVVTIMKKDNFKVKSGTKRLDIK